MVDFDRYDKDLKFEHDLINRRLTWLLTSQTILFGALAFILGKDVFVETRQALLCIIPGLGIVISASLWLAIAMSLTAKAFLWQDYKKSSGKPKERFGIRTWITFIAFAPDFFMPLGFVVAWVYILRI